MTVTCQKEASSAWTTKCAGWALVAVLFYSSLADGGARPLPIFITRVLILASVLTQIPLIFTKENYWADFAAYLKMPALLALVFLMAVAVQCFFGSKMILEKGIGTINAYATIASFIQLLFYGFFFIAAWQFLSSGKNIDKLILFLAVLVSVVTVWGLAERFAGRDLIGFDHPAQDSFGPFVNPNHYSAFTVLTLPLFLAQIHYRLKRNQAGFSWKGALNFVDSSIPFFIFLTALVFAGCFLCGARVGAAVLLALVLIYFITPDLRRHYKPLLLMVAFAFVIAFFLLGSTRGLESALRIFSLESLKAAAAERYQVAQESLQIFAQFPLGGSGLGTYAFISPKAVSVLSDTVAWEHVHNDFIELLAETGVLGFLLLGCVFIFMLVSSLRAVGNQLSLWKRFLFFQAVFALAGFALMEFADFALKIPAIALIFLVQLALLMHPHDPKTLIRPLSRPAKTFTTFFFLGAVFLLGRWSWNDYQAYEHTQAKENRIQSLESAVLLQPRNSDYWYQLGVENLKETSDASKTRALEAFQEAVRLSPTYPRYWFALGKLNYEEGRILPAADSLERASAWAPHHSGYLLYLIAFYLAAADKSEDETEKILYDDQAKITFRKLERFKTFPSEAQQVRWMGQVYAKKFQQFLPYWKIQRKVNS